MRPTRARFAAALALVAVIAFGLAGCGGAAPAPSATRALTTTPATTPTTPATATPSAATLARARRVHELPTPHGRQTVAGGWRTPAAAIEAFAVTYINWTAATVAPRLRALAESSVGQARAAVTEQAAEADRDGELQRGEIANAGSVEAIGPLAGSADRFAVVTRERTTATASTAYRGLAAAWHVAIATVTRRPDGLWVLSGWQPEN